MDFCSAVLLFAGLVLSDIHKLLFVCFFMKHSSKRLEKLNIYKSYLHCHLYWKFTEVFFSLVTSIPVWGAAAVCWSFCLFISRDTRLYLMWTIHSAASHFLVDLEFFNGFISPLSLACTRKPVYTVGFFSFFLLLFAWQNSSIPRDRKSSKCFFLFVCLFSLSTTGMDWRRETLAESVEILVYNSNGQSLLSG